MTLAELRVRLESFSRLPNADTEPDRLVTLRELDVVQRRLWALLGELNAAAVEALARGN
jgi:hypothetical protein